MPGGKGNGEPVMTEPLGPGGVLPAAGGVAVCQDCGAPISANYCANCGQETRIEVPSVRQFAHELMDQYVAVEGKLGRTLRVLLSQPGQLTLDYVQGRRQRYVRPLKLYVSISVVFFGLLGILPDSIGNPFTQVDPETRQELRQEINDDLKDEQGKADADDGDKAAAADSKPAAPAAAPAATQPAPAVAQPAAPAAAATPSADVQKDDNLDLRQQIRKAIDADLKSGQSDKIGQDIKSKVDASVKNQLSDKNSKTKDKGLAALSTPEQRKELRAKLADDAPYAMFFLMPYFALLLRWLYRKNQLRYGVHLLFTVHLHCFAFILLAFMFLPFSPLRTVLELAGVLYAFLALRRVYGGTVMRTAWRVLVLGFLDFVAVSATALSGVMTAVFGTGT
jgi:hypothetical protein